MTEKRGYGALIRAARKARHMTQKDLAGRMQTSESTISNLEREQHPPTVPDEVNDLVVALGISPSSLLAAMGVRMDSPPLERLDRAFVEAVSRLDPEDARALTPAVQRLADAGRLQVRRTQ